MSTTEQEHKAGAELVARPDASVADDVTTGEPIRSAAYVDVTKTAGMDRPVIPEHLRRENIGATLRLQRKRASHHAKFHAVRSPLHLANLVICMLRGGRRLLGMFVRWWHVTDVAIMMSAAVAAGREAHRDALKYHTEAKKTRERRSRIVLCVGILLAGALAAMVVWSPWWGWALLTTSVASVLIYNGRLAGKPLIQSAVIAPHLEKITESVIIRGLASTGIGALKNAVEKPGTVGFHTPVTRDGPGYRVVNDLPHGTTAAEVMERRDKYASGLRRDIGCVWPEADLSSGSHAGRLVTYVCDVPLREVRQPAWPLLKSGRADIFKPIPFGTDQRVRAVALTLMFANLLIGSIPRMGKTVAMRIVLLFCALDPTVELRVFELKGTGDLRPVEKCCHHYASGADDETIAACADSVRQIAEVELVRRAKVISRIAAENRVACPENKVTPDLSRDKRLGLHPIVLAIDECQEGFKHQEYGKDLARWCEQIIKRGPALGIMLVLATQKPDTKSLPTAITSNVALRFCLMVKDQPTNDMILGTGSYKQGIRATTLNIDDKGCGFLVNDDPAPTLTRTYYFQGETADNIGARARAGRERAGTLSGHALGLVAETETRDFLADVLSVFGDAEPNLWRETIATRLAEQLSEVYADITPTAVADQLRARGVAVKKVRETGQSPLAGCARSDVTAAMGVSE